MSDHTVTVTYHKNPKPGQPKVEVNPSLIQVSPGQTIKFVRGDTNDGTLRITFADRQFFATGKPEFAGSGVFHEKDGDVRVKEIPRRTKYVCELLDAAGHSIARSEANGGGAAEPKDRHK